MERVKIVVQVARGLAASLAMLLLADMMCASAALAAARQEERASAPAEAAGEPASLRRLAPGVVTVVEPDLQLEETYSRHDVVEILANDPQFGERPWSEGRSPAKQTVFRRTVWGLEFGFKPVRFIDVDVPHPGGKMQRKRVWYLVYRVTNAGGHLTPAESEPGVLGGINETQAADFAVTFVPQFLLEGQEFNKVYADRVIPVAVRAIQQREDPGRRLLNTAEIAGEIAVGETVWGVASWEEIDPRIDRFSVYVQGLTNAYQWVDPLGDDEAYRYQAGMPIGAYRRMARKTLQLNFWRPGDEFHEHEQEIRIGAPGEVDYRWVYR